MLNCWDKASGIVPAADTGATSANQTASARRRDFSMEQLPIVRMSKPSMTRRVVNVILPVLLIAAGVVVYEGSFGWGTHPIVFWSGVSLTVAGVVWLASDWFGL